MATLAFASIYMVGNPVDALAQPQSDQRDGGDHGAPRPRQAAAGSNTSISSGALHGDLGRSFVFNEPALKLILQRMPATMELALAALVVLHRLGIPLGSRRPEARELGRPLDHDRLDLGLLLPTFWVGLMLILVFAVAGLAALDRARRRRHLLGITSSLFTLDGLRHVLLPAFNLALSNCRW